MERDDIFLVLAAAPSLAMPASSPLVRMSGKGEKEGGLSYYVIMILSTVHV